MLTIGDLHLPMYLLIISFFYTFAIFWALKRIRHYNLDPKLGLDICLAVMLGGFAGARLFHILYEQPSYYLENPTDIFKFWQGGFVYYGGAVGAFVAAFILVWRKKENYRLWADIFAPIAAVGYAIGRIACFLNGCCYGKVCELPWAIHFTHGEGAGPLRHPTQLYATGWELLVFAVIFWAETKRKHNSFFASPGRLFFIWLSLHSVGRIIMEVFRDDFRGASLLGFSVSIWISLVLLAVGIYLLLSSPAPTKGADR